MIIILKDKVTQTDELELIKWLETFNVKVNPIHGSQTTILGLIGDTSQIEMDTIETHEAVEKVMKVQEPFKKANRKFHPENSIINVNGIEIGGKNIVVIAGPCSVESEAQILELAQDVKKGGAKFLRGGAFKPRTSPYAFQGMRSDGLVLLKQARELSGLPVVSEITNSFHLDQFVEYVDIIQVGARNMQNFELLKSLGEVDKPILLKRGFANTIEELLMAAEYIMSGGNEKVILCERGIRTFETATRNTLDISAIPVLKKLTHLPVVVDPSHASGHTWLVEPLSKASIAAGADGLIIEVHENPKKALSDGSQSLTPQAFSEIMKGLQPIVTAMGRTL
ncbi:MAG: 3-deoxy-7-phosphoheptulonate synthase [Bacillota bacterium]